jgi:hypothetical protein
VTHRMTFQTEPARRKITKIQQLLREQSLTLPEIADAIYLTVYWARAYINYLHDERQVHIAAWRVHKRATYSTVTPMYVWGAGEDAEKPALQTDTERRRAARAILAADPIEHAASLARRRAKAAKPTRDWAASWIPTKGAP